jgi:dihydrofolate reductase
MPKLKNRTIIVVSSTLENKDDLIVAKNFDEAVDLAFKLNPL